MADTSSPYFAIGACVSSVSSPGSIFASTSSPVTTATRIGVFCVRAIAMIASAAAIGLAAPMLVIRRTPCRRNKGSSSSMRRSSNGS